MRKRITAPVLAVLLTATLGSAAPPAAVPASAERPECDCNTIEDVGEWPRRVLVHLLSVQFHPHRVRPLLERPLQWVLPASVTRSRGEAWRAAVALHASASLRENCLQAGPSYLGNQEYPAR